MLGVATMGRARAGDFLEMRGTVGGRAGRERRDRRAFGLGAPRDLRDRRADMCICICKKVKSVNIIHHDGTLDAR